MSLPLRRVGMRDNLVMLGNHHMPAGKRHWRAAASSFALLDQYDHPQLWIEGPGIDRIEVVGDMAMTVAKPVFDRGDGLPVVPNANETLMGFGLVRSGGLPMIRTWWALGPNVDRTMRRARHELFNPKTWPERMTQLLQLMGWIS